MAKVLIVLICLGIVHRVFGALYCEDGQLRLVDGSQWNMGRLEACYHNEWGTVCNQWFDIDDARVACGKLGFDAMNDNDDLYVISSAAGPNAMKIAVGFLQCTGVEADFLECNQDLGRTFVECTHSYDVWLTCPVTGCSDGDIRLIGGHVETEGTLEVCKNNAWNAICADSFGQADAFVACRELGYPTTNIEIVTDYRINYGHGNPTLVTGFNCYGNEATLYGCDKDSTCETFYENHPFFRIVGLKCNGETVPACTSQVRLADGPSDDEGRLEYCLNGAWGTVGALNFDVQDGQVACKGLYSPPARAKVYAGGNYGTGDGGVYYDDVACIGSEPSVLTCPSNTDTFDNDHSNDVGLKCMPRVVADCTQNDIRLSNGGRVEVCNNEEWGSICSEDWDRNDARVACRQLGFSATSYASYYTASEFGDGDIQMFASELACSGSESNLYGGCTKNDAKLSPYCIAGKTAGVRCFEPQNDDECVSGDVRLSPKGQSNREGDVQICRNGVWGYVCAGGNDVNNADVICRELGYPSSWSLYSTYGLFNGSQDIGPIMYDAINCNGNEDALADCPFSDYGASNPTCTSVLGVQCHDTVTCNNGDIVLKQGGDSLEGRVEVCTDNSYATVSDNDWDFNDAQVVCRQLGYHAPWSVAVTGDRFTNGRKRVAYSNTSCSGGEASLSDCVKDTTYSEDDPIQVWYYTTRAGVECQELFDPVSCTEGELRLVRDEQYNNMNNEREGRLEFCINGYWVTFCSQGWTPLDTAAACRNLGFETLDPRQKFSGQGTGPVYHSPQCEGHESDLWNQCSPSNAQGTNNCGHFNDVGIECPATAAPFYQVRVVPAVEGPYPIGSNVSMQCVVEPTPPPGFVYSWQSLVTVGALYSDPSSSWATVTIGTGTPSFGHLYCEVSSADDFYGIGVARVDVQGVLAPVAPEVAGEVGDDITLTISRTTDHAIVSKLLDLNWYYEGTKITDLMAIWPNKFSLSADWLSLTISKASWDDAGLYQAQYDRLSLYYYDEGCEKLSIDILRNFPVMSAATFAVSVGGSTVSLPGPDPLLVTNPKYQTFTRDTGRVQFDVTRQTSLRDSALEIHTSTLFQDFILIKSTANVPNSRIVLSNVTVFDYGLYESELTLNLDTVLTDAGCDLSFGNQYKQFFNDYLNLYDYVSIDYSLALLQYYEYPTVNLTSDRAYFMASMNAVLTCSPWGGYPLHHAMSINKNGQVVASALTYGEDFVYTTSDDTPQKYGVYWCIVNNTVVESMSSVLVQEAATFGTIIQVESCADWDDTDIPAIEMALLKRFEEACDCTLDRSIFWQSTFECSDDRIDEEIVKGLVNVSTIFVYSNDDGDVTASTVIDAYDGEISRGVNQFLIVNGMQLQTGEREPPTKAGLSTGAIVGIAVGCVAAVVIVLVGLLIVIIVCCVKMRKRGKESSAGRINAAYDARDEKAVLDDDD